MLANSSVNVVAFMREDEHVDAADRAIPNRWNTYYRDAAHMDDVGGIRLRGIAGYGDADHLARTAYYRELIVPYVLASAAEGRHRPCGRCGPYQHAHGYAEIGKCYTNSR